MSDPARPRPISPRRAAEAVAGARTSLRDGVAVVRLTALRDPLPVGLADGLEVLVAEGPVIVDLSETVLVAARPVNALVGWLVALTDDADRCCVVCPRDTARALLGRWHITRSVAVFASVGDALQARQLRDAGYGPGWAPDPLRTPGSDHAVACLEAIVEYFQRHDRPAGSDVTDVVCRPSVLDALDDEGLITSVPGGWVPTMLGLRKIDALQRATDSQVAPRREHR